MSNQELGKTMNTLGNVALAVCFLPEGSLVSCL